MAFPFAAVGLGLLGIGTSIVQGNQQRDAARSQNEAAEEQAEAQFERATKEWKIDYQTRQTNYLWDVAKLEAQKFAERQSKADYEQRQGQLIDSAIRNLEVNSQALNDRFITEEALRGKQVNLDLAFKQAEISTRANEQLRLYMNDIKDRGMQAAALVQGSQNEAQQLQAEAVLGFQQEALERDIQNVAAVVGAASTRAVASQRQGGGSSSQRLALNSIQELGRTYGLLENRNRSRQARIGLFNGTMQGERATELGRYALASQNNAERMKYSTNSANRESAYNLDVFKDLTMPSFDLATRQGKRELESLYIQTEARIDEASQPFRESIWFDPLEPIAGLKPEYYAPTKVYEPSGLDIGLNALSAGVSGAMSASYQKPGGGIGFF